MARCGLLVALEAQTFLLLGLSFGVTRSWGQQLMCDQRVGRGRALKRLSLLLITCGPIRVGFRSAIELFGSWAGWSLDSCSGQFFTQADLLAKFVHLVLIQFFECRTSTHPNFKIRLGHNFRAKP